MPKNTRAKESYERYKRELSQAPTERDTVDSLLDRIYDNTIGLTEQWRNIPERGGSNYQKADKHPSNVVKGDYSKSMTKPRYNRGGVVQKGTHQVAYAEGGVVEQTVKEGNFKEYERFPVRPLEQGESVPLPGGGKATEYTVSIPTTRKDQWITAPSIWMTPSGARRFGDSDVRRLVKQYEDRTGKKFPRHKSVEEAEGAAKARSEAGGVGSGPLAKEKDMPKDFRKGSKGMSYAGGGMAKKGKMAEGGMPNGKKRTPNTPKRAGTTGTRGKRSR